MGTHHRCRRCARRHLHLVAALVGVSRESSHRDRAARTFVQPHHPTRCPVSRSRPDGSTDEPSLKRSAATAGVRGDDSAHHQQPVSGCRDSGVAPHKRPVAGACCAGAIAVGQLVGAPIQQQDSSRRDGGAEPSSSAGHRGRRIHLGGSRHQGFRRRRRAGAQAAQ